MTTPQLGLCLCKRACLAGGSCASPITQEDLLCDYCRANPDLHCHQYEHIQPFCEIPNHPYYQRAREAMDASMDD